MKSLPEKEITPADEFLIRRIAEFPTLYRCKDDVIAQCVFGNMGRCFWKDGRLAIGEQHFNIKKKTWTQFPLQISLEVAKNFLNQSKIPAMSYDIGRGPIKDLPNDADDSWLTAISIFLSTWGKLTLEDWEILTKAYYLKHYQRQSNQYSHDKMADFVLFHKQVPGWKAQVAAVRYFKRFGNIDPATYMGEGI